MSVSSGALREGLLVTRPFLSTGTSLVINGRCGKDGYILAEVLDHFDELMPGRSRQACDVFTGDSVSHKVTWQGESELPAARPEFGGDTVFPWKKTTPYRKLRFFLRNAELFSFRLTEA